VCQIASNASDFAAGSATAGTDRECAREMSLTRGSKRRGLLVPDMNPFDLALAAERVSQPVETIADEALNTLDARPLPDFRRIDLQLF
jgi:hypothetical protein